MIKNYFCLFVFFANLYILIQWHFTFSILFCIIWCNCAKEQFSPKFKRSCFLFCSVYFFYSSTIITKTETKINKNVLMK